MPVTPEDVQVGRCFITEPAKQVRRVTEITGDDRVNYKARGSEHKGKDCWGFGPPVANLPTRKTFAEQVDRRITCDWDKNYPERTPSDDDDRKYSE
jgi:hypothetical protein